MEKENRGEEGEQEPVKDVLAGTLVTQITVLLARYLEEAHTGDYAL